jgi:hypothetical protein
VLPLILYRNISASDMPHISKTCRILLLQTEPAEPPRAVSVRMPDMATRRHHAAARGGLSAGSFDLPIRAVELWRIWGWARPRFQS